MWPVRIRPTGGRPLTARLPRRAVQPQSVPPWPTDLTVCRCDSLVASCLCVGSSLRGRGRCRAAGAGLGAAPHGHGQAGAASPPVDRQHPRPEDAWRRPTKTIAAARSQNVNGMGTGVVIDERGYILTNHHVVDGVEEDPSHAGRRRADTSPRSSPTTRRPIWRSSRSTSRESCR